MRKESHKLAGQEVEIKTGTFKGEKYRIEDYWHKVAGKSWMFCDGNPACLKYAIRSASDNIPTDNEVLYGKIGALGHLVHVSEIENPQANSDKV